MTNQQLIEEMARAMCCMGNSCAAVESNGQCNRHVFTDSCKAALAVALPAIIERCVDTLDNERKIQGYHPTLPDDVRDYAEGYDAALRHMIIAIRELGEKP